MATWTAGCTFLITFHEEDAAVTRDASTTGEAGVPDDVAGEDGESGPRCAPDAGEGARWDMTDDTARCCKGSPVHTNTAENCGACGIRCNAALGQKCAKIVDQWYCVGCVADSAAASNDSCWSRCCSVQFYNAGACAASVCATGACNQAVCPTGTTCKTASGSSNYCGYDP
jgi:hypothetical protein